jgi:hypothetical protein
MARCGRNECRKWRPNMVVNAAGIGLRVDEQWFCSAACVEAAAERRLGDVRQASAGVSGVPPLRLGVLLLHQNAVSREVLAQALEMQKGTGLRLGAQLLRMNACEGGAILRALAAQAGVSFLSAVDLKSVADAPGGFSSDEVQALGLVPFRADAARQRLLVACRAPLPRAALAALRQLAQWNPEPYIVSDADAEALLQAYGTGRAEGRRKIAFTRVRAVHDAARGIATAAAADRAVSVTETRWEPYTLVRVEGPTRITSMLVVPDQIPDQSKEDTCQAAITLP